jgi:hypothetical protein
MTYFISTTMSSTTNDRMEHGTPSYNRKVVLKAVLSEAFLPAKYFFIKPSKNFIKHLTCMLLPTCSPGTWVMMVWDPKLS